jgi:hypothetical protein
MTPILQASFRLIKPLFALTFLVVFAFLAPPQYLRAQCSLSAPTFGNNDAVCRFETTLRNGGMRVSCATCTGGGTAAVTWWTAATGGIQVGTGNPFNPIVAGVVNNSVVGVTRLFAQCECGGCVSTARTAVEFRIFDRPAPVISGVTLACPNTLTTYSTPSVSGNAYAWTITPAGFGSIVSGAGTNSIQVRWTTTENAGPFTIRLVQTNANGCSFANEMTVFTRQTTMNCLGNVNISLDEDCKVQVTASNLTGISRGSSDMRVQLLTPGNQILEDGVGSILVDGISGSGGTYFYNSQTLRYRIIEPCNNTECSGTIFFTDRTPPAMTCPADITLSCVQVPSSTPDTSVSGRPTLSDCSSMRLTYTDVVRTTNCSTPFTAIPSDLLAEKNATLPTTGDVVKIILRTFLARDAVGNERSCSQYIFVRKAVIRQVVCPPRNLEYRCEDYFNVAPLPSVAGEPMLDADGNMTTTNDRVPILQGSCDFTATFSDVVQVNCSNSRRIIRTWVITDVCNFEATTCTQIIQIVDKTPPSVRAEFAQIYVFNQQLFRRDTIVDFDGFSIVNGGGSANGTVQDVYTRSQSVNCGGTTRLVIRASDPNCTRAALRVECSDTRFQMVAGFPQFNATTGESMAVFDGVFDSPGSFEVVFNVTDACGNISTKRFRIQVVDNMPPQIITEPRANVTLGLGGIGRLPVSVLNRGSLDNCFVRRFQARRLSNCQAPADTLLRDTLFFYCCDIGTPQNILVRVTDGAGNFSESVLPVNVTENEKPTCFAPASVDLSCRNFDPNTPLSTFGAANFFDNCSLRDTVYTETRNISTCNAGSIERKWVISDKSGLKDSCIQTIRLLASSDFTVDFPDDITTTCADTLLTREQVVQAMLNNPTTTDGHILNEGCGNISVEVSDDTVRNALNACLVIMRRITVLDRCKYNPNNSYTYTDGSKLGFPVCGDRHSRSNWATENSEAWSFLTRSACTTTRERRFRDADNLGVGQHFNSFNDGIISFVQIIKINDNTPPVFTQCGNNSTITSRASATDCLATVELNVAAEDRCAITGSTSRALPLNYVWTITDSTTNQVAKRGVGNSLSESLPFGTYTVRWEVRDLCNNAAICSQKIRVLDATTPSVFCQDKTVNLMGSANDPKGIVRISDIYSNVSDNCSPKSLLMTHLKVERALGADTSARFPIGSSLDTVLFTCADVGQQISVRLWTCDAAGNAGFCKAIITVQDSARLCEPQTRSVVTGLVRTETGVNIENVQITAKQNTNTLGVATTTANGLYQFQNLEQGTNLSLRPQRTGNAVNGVSTSDIAAVSRHVLGRQILNSAYKIIAADVNRDGDVSSLDMLLMRRLVLLIDTAFSGNVSWRFVDARYNFIDPSDPLAEDFPEIALLNNLAASTQANFIGIKLGDVNNTVRANGEPQIVIRNQTPDLIFEMDDQKLEAGKDYEIQVRVKDFKSTGYQFTLNFTEGVKIEAIEAGDLPQMGAQNFGRFKSALTTSWNGFYVGDGNAFRLKIRATQNIRLSEAFSIGSNLTTAEAYDVTGATQSVKLRFTNSNTEGGNFTLYQNNPNPFSTSTTVAFHLPVAAHGKLTFYNAAGQVLKTIAQDFGQGYNQVSLSQFDLQAKGLVYYRLETATHTATRKMIID